MRYDANHKERTRARVLAEAASAIESKGVERVGVVEVMAGAGLTHGGGIFAWRRRPKSRAQDATKDFATNPPRPLVA